VVVENVTDIGYTLSVPVRHNKQKRLVKESLTMTNHATDATSANAQAMRSPVHGIEEIELLYQHHLRQIEKVSAIFERVEAREILLSNSQEEALYSDRDTLRVEADTLAWMLGLATFPAYAITNEVEDYDTEETAEDEEPPSAEEAQV
jgi:hypothetical protein